MNAASAGIPELGLLFSEVERLNRPSTALSKAIAGANAFPVPSSSACTGDLHIGVFFDGTGNNKAEDYGPENNPKLFLKRKHSNVVRLYNMFPDERSIYRQENKSKDDQNQFYRIYVPGVGTPFPEIGDEGTGAGKMLGAGFGKGGEARILWAMIQVLNAVYRFKHEEAEKLISDLEALSIIDGIKRISQVEKKRAVTFKNLIDTRLVIPDTKPTLRNIYIYTFGFSRGAAEARAFSNWMAEALREAMPKPPQSGGYRTGTWLKERPVHFPFLGIFDTVASVGMAGMYSIAEGHLSWGHKTQEITGHIRKCVHLVAAHEVRACFPLDSVRVDGKCPPNCEEIVYPGAHSDIGGGYAFNALGKADVDTSSAPRGPFANGDLQISRVPGFDMYLRACKAGVPFYTVEQMEAQGRAEVAKDLLPDVRTLQEIQDYLNVSNEKIGGLPVEEQLYRHTSLYLHWRWKEGFGYASSGAEVSRLSSDAADEDAINKKKEEVETLTKKAEMEMKFARGPGSHRRRLKKAEAELAEMEARLSNPASHKASDEMAGLRRTQKEFFAVLAAYNNEMIRRTEEMKRNASSHVVDQDCSPLDNPYGISYYLKKKSFRLMRKLAEILEQGNEATINDKGHVAELEKELGEDAFFANCNVAQWALDSLKDWRTALKDCEVAEEHDTIAPEREAMRLFDGLAFGSKYEQDKLKRFASFFAKHVHDSMAGFDVPEYPFNGYGIGKYRRVFFGDNADQFAREQAEETSKAHRNGKRFYRGAPTISVPRLASGR